MTPLQSVYADVTFRLAGLNWLDVLDLALVTIAFYLLLHLMRRSQAAFLLRGALGLALVLFVVTILLPLPTFNWLVQGVLIAMVMASLVIFQPELRRLLGRTSRKAGLAWTVRQSPAQNLLPRLLRSVEALSAHQTGALIVLEGQDSLQEVLETGVDIGGPVTSELLQTIFHQDTPLHDGAIILRDDVVVAAGCVLPLTQQSLDGERRLGTRHQAAVGLSEITDALVIVVSEETGQISVAYHGQLWRSLDSVTLRQQLSEFYALSAATPSALSLQWLANWLGRQLRPRPVLPTLRRLSANIAFAFISLLLALATWSFVSEQTNPTRRLQVEDITLRVEDLPAGATLMTPLPATVSALIQTTAEVRDTLRSSSFQAIVSLEDLPPGLHHLPVQVTSGAAQVRVLAVDPPRLDLELAPVISHTLPVTVDLPEPQALSPAYTMISTPAAVPEEVQVIGPAPLVEQVSQIQATISLAKASTSLRELRPLKALDGKGHEVIGVNLQPPQVQVNVAIRRRVDARDVGIRVITTGTPPPGYWLSGLSVTPAGITLQGNPDRLAELGSFVDTLPIEVSEAAGDLNMLIPLDLPPDLQALDSEGNPMRNVKVLVQITARQGDLVVSRSVELVNLKPEVVATVNPSEVELLLSGPLPTLNRIEANKQLVRVFVDATPLDLNQSADLEPTIMAPDGIKVQMAPHSVLVTYLNQPTVER